MSRAPKSGTQGGELGVSVAEGYGSDRHGAVRQFEKQLAEAIQELPRWSPPRSIPRSVVEFPRPPVIQLDYDGHPAPVVAARDSVPSLISSVELQRNRAAAVQEVSPPVLGAGKHDTDGNLAADPPVTHRCRERLA